MKMFEDAAQPEFWGQSDSLIAVKEHISRAAKINRPILLSGERGTGKELAAARLHYLSPRWDKPRLTVNCAALSPNLVESELFGHQAGAFTGARGSKMGFFEAASGGTLFLDEISHLTLNVQAKLLRVVEYGLFQPVGAVREKKTEARLVSASNQDLAELCRKGDFLPDLYDRLSFDIIYLPPLRERPGDIILLARRFAVRMALELGLDGQPDFSPKVLAALEKYPWPGNVRELKNVVERALYRADSLLMEEKDLSFSSPGLAPAFEGPRAPGFFGEAEANLQGPLGPGGFDAKMAEAGLDLIDRALDLNRNSQRAAADFLGLGYHRFRFLRKKFQETLAAFAEGPERSGRRTSFR